jgi:putative ABC transport system substrate-binding protein
VNNRRKLLVALGGSALLAPFGSFAQQARKSVVVGVLRYGDQPSGQLYVTAFKQGLQELGYIEGRNLALELRYAEGKAERLAVLAEELVRLNVDVILTGDTPSTLAAQRATRVIPIVIGSATDPVGSGLVASLAHPGGNTTGFSNMTSDISPKRLEMLIALIPGLSRVAVLLDPKNPATRLELKSLEEANQRVGLRLLALRVETPEQIERAFAAMVKQRAQGVIVTSNSFFTQQRYQIAGLALKHRIPSLCGNSRFADAGLLVSYGEDSTENYRRAATYVDKIVKGTKPADLPVEQPMTIELVINMKTARAIGIKVPKSILLHANRVIE